MNTINTGSLRKWVTQIWLEAKLIMNKLLSSVCRWTIGPRAQEKWSLVFSFCGSGQSQHCRFSDLCGLLHLSIKNVRVGMVTWLQPPSSSSTLRTLPACHLTLITPFSTGQWRAAPPPGKAWVPAVAHKNLYLGSVRVSRIWSADWTLFLL